MILFFNISVFLYNVCNEKNVFLKCLEIYISYLS